MYQSMKCNFIWALFLLTIVPICHSQAVAQSRSAFYDFSEPYADNNTGLFRGVEVTPLLAIEDTGIGSISEIRDQDVFLNWKDASSLYPEQNASYWLKTKIAGHRDFFGRHIFQVGQELGNDLHAFDFIDAYIVDQFGQVSHQSLGRRIPVEDRPVQLWMNLIEIDLLPTDSISLYIRLKDMSKSYPLSSVRLWHMDEVVFNKSQVTLGQKSYLFYGVLGIQILFFFFLFLIEREVIYISFSVFGLGFFLARIFTEFNFSSIVPIPSLMEYNEPLFHLSVFVTIAGGLFFMTEYLQIPKDSFFRKRFIPIYLPLTLLSYTVFLCRYAISDDGSYPVIFMPAPYTFLGIIYGSYVAARSSFTSRRTLLMLCLTLIPLILSISLVLLNNDAHLTFQVSENLLPGFLNKQAVDDILRVLLILWIVAISLNVGFRSMTLKAEKDKAISDKLEAQKIIMEKQLRTEKLREINAMKARLYTNMTHEFRTPLTVIMGVNDELSETTATIRLSEKIKQKVLLSHGLIQRNCQSLLRLVNQLLELSKAENHQMELQMSQGDIIPYLNYLTESFYSKAREKNLQLVFYTDLRSLMMDYEEQKIQQIIYNLLSNAIKFTPAYGKIIIHADVVDNGDTNELLIKVKDSGVGIAHESLPFIFDRFYQIEDSSTRRYEGSGIGLSLTKEIVELMKGTITVDSVEGEGSTFSVQIPITTEAKKLERRHKPESQHLNTGIELDEVIIPDLQEELDESFSQPVLLIVEDNRDVSTFLKMVLSETYSIIEAVNGEDGINMAIDHVPDLIISDVMMPIKDGYELTETLKEDRRTSHIPIVLLTAKVAAESRKRGFRSGADAYLEKPINREDLLLRINSLFENRKKLRGYLLESQSKLNKGGVINDIEIKTKDSRVAKEQQFLEDIHQIVLDALQSEELNAHFIAHRLGVSRSQFYRKIKALTGLSPNIFIRDIKLEQSKPLLNNEDLNISEVAFRVGFSNPSYYSRVFHQKYGISPHAFRSKK